MKRTIGRIGCAAWVLLASLAGCAGPRVDGAGDDAGPFVMVLGTAQDGGYPQAACRRACCAAAWSDPSLRRLVASLAIVDPASGGRWIVDATPDFREQIRLLDEAAGDARSPGGADLDGVFLTHAHMGHYTGLMHLGREAIGGAATRVYAMPRMAGFLEGNGPWDLLAEGGYIEIGALHAGEPVRLAEGLTIMPIVVPHRDEYSETVGYRIEGPDRSVLYIPDIDKWERWDRSIEMEIEGVDVAYLDGTFFGDGEIPGRNMAEIPHPFIEESMDRFATLTAGERAKIRFIHLNHTNPALRAGTEASRRVESAGFAVAEQGERVPLGGR